MEKEESGEQTKFIEFRVAGLAEPSVFKLLCFLQGYVSGNWGVISGTLKK